MYPCIIKAGPLRVINIVQKSSNMLDPSVSLSLQNSQLCKLKKNALIYTHGVLMHTRVHVVTKTCMYCTCMQVAPAHLVALGLCKAIHEQQALLTTLAPLH